MSSTIFLSCPDQTCVFPVQVCSASTCPQGMRAALFPLQRDCQWSGGTLGLASKLLGAAFCFWSNLDRTSCCHSSRSRHALFLIFGPTPAMASSSRSKELRCQMPFFPFAFNGFWCGLWKSVGGGTGHEAWTRRRGGGRTSAPARWVPGCRRCSHRWVGVVGGSVAVALLGRRQIVRTGGLAEAGQPL